MADHVETSSLFEALQPLLRRLSVERTLSPGKLGVLRHLAERGRATTSELAVVVRVSPQAISLASRELEGLGCVVRVPDVEDRRRVWLEVTDAGRQKLTEELKASREWLDQAIATRLTPRERTALETVVPLLRKLASETAVD